MRITTRAYTPVTIKLLATFTDRTWKPQTIIAKHLIRKMNNSSSIYDDDVVRTSSGAIFNPMVLSFPAIITKLVLVSTGIPFNLLVIIPLVHVRRLRKKVRHVFQSGISLSYLSFFVPPIIELLYYLRPNDYVCQTFMATMLVPQAFVLINCILALIDRSLAMAYPLMHRERMTGRLARYVMIACSTLIVLLIKFDYISDPADLRCEIRTSLIQKSVIVLIGLLVSCLSLNIYVYKQTKKHLNEAKTVRLGASTTYTDNSIINEHSVSEPMSVHISKKRLNQMELEANLTLVISVGSLCVTPLLGIGFVASYLACEFIYGESECGGFTLVGPYIRDVSLFPAIYGPIILLIRNEELRQVFDCRRKRRANSAYN
ncbi:hypothetical protein GHT06_013926 [Daphnia sinensis]|uniref:G-protein coupled receptors family 1 profile domain-containing protein n=1 Tax=Daphnia sinensis TaxID=1820382 RepID=A0AAD5PXF4_9CRUS|nr:hypothetical protein GHT06_013926 [Daphnia sinensis]